MHHIVKKNIRLLSERYHHTLVYGNNALTMTNAINSIEIRSKSKYGFEITYNTKDALKHTSVSSEGIYDSLISLFKRPQTYELRPKNSTFLSLNDWIEAEEGTPWIHKAL